MLFYAPRCVVQRGTLHSPTRHVVLPNTARCICQHDTLRFWLHAFVLFNAIAVEHLFDVVLGELRADEAGGRPLRVDAAIRRSPGVLATLVPSVTERRHFQRRARAKVRLLIETTKYKRAK